MSSKNLYEDDFDKISGRRESAYRIALDIRKFEIDLYWKRTAYFLAFITLIAAAYGSVLTSAEAAEPPQTPNVDRLLFVSSLGLIFSIAWFLANKGSKFWQENWENHVDLMEDDFSGPLYKTVLSRPERNDIKTVITGPAPYSVSKLNQILSLYVTFIWLTIFLYHCLPISPELAFSPKRFLIILSVLIVVFLLFFHSKTHDPYHSVKSSKRKTQIV